MKPIKLKSLDEVLERFKMVVRRYRRRFLKRNLRPCPNNCSFADVVGQRVIGCTKCKSHNPDLCRRPENFVSLYTKDELADQFKHALRDPQVLLREYRDIVVFLWITGQFDAEEIPEQIIQKVDEHGSKNDKPKSKPSNGTSLTGSSASSASNKS